MQAKLQQIEVQAVVMHNDDLAVQHALRWQRPAQRLQQLREIPVQRLLVAALNKHFLTVAKHQSAETVPLGLEYPAVALRKSIHALGQHWQNRGVERQVHKPHGSPKDVLGLYIMEIQRFYLGCLAHASYL